MGRTAGAVALRAAGGVQVVGAAAQRAETLALWDAEHKRGVLSSHV